MIDRIGMLNRALVRIGADPVQSEADPLALPHLAVFDSLLERLASYPFTFFKQTLRLSPEAQKPSPLWQYGYRMPGDMIGAPRALYETDEMRQPTAAYEIEGDFLLSDHPQLWLTYTRAKPPVHWPGDFRELFVVALMAELALSIREDRSLHDRLYQKAFGTPSQAGEGGLLMAALQANSQGRPATVVGMGVNPLVDVRR